MPTPVTALPTWRVPVDALLLEADELGLVLEEAHGGLAEVEVVDRGAVLEVLLRQTDTRPTHP